MSMLNLLLINVIKIMNSISFIITMSPKLNVFFLSFPLSSFLRITHHGNKGLLKANWLNLQLSNEKEIWKEGMNVYFREHYIMGLILPSLTFRPLDSSN